MRTKAPPPSNVIDLDAARYPPDEGPDCSFESTTPPDMSGVAPPNCRKAVVCVEPEQRPHLFLYRIARVGPESRREIVEFTFIPLGPETTEEDLSELCAREGWRNGFPIFDGQEKLTVIRTGPVTDQDTGLALYMELARTKLVPAALKAIRADIKSRSYRLVRFF